MDTPVFIHVGFCNTGTTSLQQNFFLRRQDLFAITHPYHEHGGIFTAIKSSEDFKFDVKYVEDLRKELIDARHCGRTVVISDETLCDTPQWYFAPLSVPRDVIARRLHHFFPAAKIIFTIREQRQYLASMYFNLKRNAVLFAGMRLPPLSVWLTGMLSQERGHYLQNLNFWEAVNLYADIFGRQNVCVLPLEMAVMDGARRYLQRLCDFLQLELTDADVRNFAEIYNRRMSARLELLAELIQEDRFGRRFPDLIEDLGGERLIEVLDDGPRAAVQLSNEDEARIRSRVDAGNWLLAREFGLALDRYGYAQVDDSEFNRERLALARQEIEFRRELAQLNGQCNAADLAQIRRAAEVVALRERLARVSQSRAWRGVHLLVRMQEFLAGSLRPAPRGSPALRGRASATLHPREQFVEPPAPGGTRKSASQPTKPSPGEARSGS